MLRALAAILLVSLAIPLAGCVVEDPGPGGYVRGGRFCLNHPYNVHCR